jgi:hypothetical protein
LMYAMKRIQCTALEAGYSWDSWFVLGIENLPTRALPRRT